MVAIFNERIAVDYEKNQIRNINSIVWAWDENAKNIVASSREIPFVIEN
jgi:hypothetical protein